MKLKKGKLLIMLIVSGMLVGIGAGIIYIYFFLPKPPGTPEVLVLGIIIFAIGTVLTISSFRSNIW